MQIHMDLDQTHWKKSILVGVSALHNKCKAINGSPAGKNRFYPRKMFQKSSSSGRAPARLFSIFPLNQPKENESTKSLTTTVIIFFVCSGNLALATSYSSQLCTPPSNDSSVIEGVQSQCFKTFSGAQKSIPSMAGRYDNPICCTGPPGYIGMQAESVPGLLERLQIQNLYLSTGLMLTCFLIL